MKATEFCNFFEFTLTKETGFVPDNDYPYVGIEKYNYIATDNQGVFSPRYVENINDLIDCFDSCLKDYVDDDLEENGFAYDESSSEAYYEQALTWCKTHPELYGEFMIELLAALTTGKLEDDT